MHKPLRHRALSCCKDRLLLWVRHIKKDYGPVVTGLFRSPAQRKRLALAVFLLFLIVSARTYLVRPDRRESSVPLLIGETIRDANFPPQEPRETKTPSLVQLEQEIIDLRSKVEKFTEEADQRQKPAGVGIRPADFCRPAAGRVIRGPGWIRNGREWRYHSGVDLGLPDGQPVLACADGRIKEVKTHPVLGTMIRIDHGSGWESIYGRLTAVCVSGGQEVEKGTVLGKASSKACGPEPGIHFDLLYQGEEIDPRSVIPGL
ncbi:MAG TPA: M23 family metallopeptidase [Bacillota bacterium]